MNPEESRAMSTPMSEEELQQIAEKRVAARLGWYWHFAAWAAVNLYLFLNSSAGFGHGRWSMGPLLGWGLGLALHGISVFIVGKNGGLRDRMVSAERERILRDRNLR